MTVKKNVIQKKDYEQYAVRLPFRVFLSRKKIRNRFLFGELEKLHPCFSDECTFDSKLRLGKKGAFSDVVVMNSLKLSEYKSRYLGKRLFLEDNPKKCVFKKTSRLTKIFILFLAAGILISALTLPEKAGSEEKVLSVEETKESLIPSENLSPGKAPCEITDYFLSVIEGDSAFLSGLEWKCDGLNESFSASVGYIHPERLLGFSDLEVSDVKYKDNIPFFSVKGKSRLRKINMNANELVWANGKNGVFKMEKEDFAGFRKIIEGEGAELVEENFNPWKIRFVMKNAGLEETENLIARLAAFVLERGIAIRRLVIRKGGFDDFELEIETSSELEPWMGVNLSILEKRFRLFGLKNKREKVQSYQIAVGKEGKNASDKDKPVPGQKIGEIRHKDGSYVLYYKNHQGKIVSEMRK